MLLLRRVYNKPHSLSQSPLHPSIIQPRSKVFIYHTHTHNPPDLPQETAMGLSVKVFMVVLLLLAATEEEGGSVQVALARNCTTLSHKFHGACRDTKCESFCLAEGGYTGGKCGGHWHRCFCTRHC